MQKIGITVGAIAITYFLIGVIINVVQAYTGTPCNPLLDEVHKVDLSEPTGGLHALWWLPNFYEEVVEQKVGLGEYFSPTVCVTRESTGARRARRARGHGKLIARMAARRDKTPAAGCVASGSPV